MLEFLRFLCALCFSVTTLILVLVLTEQVHLSNYGWVPKMGALAVFFGVYSYMKYKEMLIKK